MIVIVIVIIVIVIIVIVIIVIIVVIIVVIVVIVMIVIIVIVIIVIVIIVIVVIVVIIIGRKKMFYLTTHIQHILFTVIWHQTWLRTILIVRKETHCRHIGNSFRLAARVLLYAPSHRQDIWHWLEREIAQWGILTRTHFYMVQHNI